MKVLIILFFSVVAPIWIVFHFVFSRKTKRSERGRGRRQQQLEASKSQFKNMEHKLRQLEEYVTSSTYQLNKELNNL